MYLSREGSAIYSKRNWDTLNAKGQTF